MVVWFCASLDDHKPNTPFSDVSRPYGVANPCAHRGNRIGGHKNRSFLYGTVRPRVNSECGIMYNPRPLAFEACLKRLALTQQVSMPWNRHHGTESHQNQKKIRNSVSTSPGTDQFTRLGSRLELCSAGKPQYGQLSVAMGSIARACKRLHPLRECDSPYRCNRTVRSWKECLGSSTFLTGLAST